MKNMLSGAIVVDKHAYISSAKLLAKVKKLSKAAKAGHTGTLDPFATGVMVCCLNNATKLARFLLNDNKTYRAVLCLGIETDTQDLTGTVISKCDKTDFSEEKIRSVFQQFKGTTKQAPPVFSALKHNGIPLYKLARSGNPVQKPPRRVHISDIKIVEINLPRINFEVSCSAGTYIRTLCADIGAILGCGGHLENLRRTESCGFTIKEAVTLSELEDLESSGKLSGRIINMPEILRKMPEHTADDVLADRIKHGNIIDKKDFIFKHSEGLEGFVKVVDKCNDLIAVLSYKSGSNKYNYCCAFPKY